MWWGEVCGTRFFRRIGETADAPHDGPPYLEVGHRCASEEPYNLSLLYSMCDLMKEFVMKDPFCTVIELLILSEKQSTIPSEMAFE